MIYVVATEGSFVLFWCNKDIVIILLDWHVFNAALGCQWVNVNFSLFLTLKYTVK